MNVCETCIEDIESSTTVVGTSFVYIRLKDTFESFNYYYWVKIWAQVQGQRMVVYGKLVQGKWKRKYCSAATRRFSDYWKSHPLAFLCVRVFISSTFWLLQFNVLSTMNRLMVFGFSLFLQNKCCSVSLRCCYIHSVEFLSKIRTMHLLFWQKACATLKSDSFIFAMS